MSTLSELAGILSGYPGPLPAAARTLMLDAAATENDADVTAAILSRADLTADEARRIREHFTEPPLPVRVAWLTRPEHDPAAFSELLIAEAGHGEAGANLGLTDLACEVLDHPLCRPQIVDVLAASDDLRLTAAVAKCARLPLDVRTGALLRTDTLLAERLARPEPAPSAVYTMCTLLAETSATEPALATSWCRHLRTPLLVLAAASALREPDVDTTRHALHSGVLPALAGPVGESLADNIHTTVLAGRVHLTADERATLLDALRGCPDAKWWVDLVKLVAILSVDDALTQPTYVLAYDDDVASARAAVTDRILTALGDNTDAWQALRAAAVHGPRNISVSELITVANGIALTADRGNVARSQEHHGPGRTRSRL